MDVQYFSEENYQLAMNYVDNEEYQNSTLANPFLKRSVLEGSAVDYLVNNHETFGLSIENPVPVNGPVGEQTYLSRLRTLDGHGFVFHRLGSEGVVDIFEAISFDGEHHLEIFMDMYHPRRSRLAIKGFKLFEEPQAFTGFTSFQALFPFNYSEYLSDVPEQLRIAYATAEQMEPIMNHLINVLVDFDDMEEQILTQPEPKSDSYQWRKLVSDQDWAKSKAQRGFIVPNPKDGVRVFPGPKGIYGWTPSAAKAKRLKMNEDDLYDPVAVMVLEGVSMYFELLPDEVGKRLQITPDHVYFDEEGFFTSFKAQSTDSDLTWTKDLMDFLTEFYFGFRTYAIQSWLSAESGSSRSTSSKTFSLNFRWMNGMSFIGSSWDEKQGNIKKKKPFKINSNGSLERLEPVVVGICPFCGEETLIWATPEKRLAIKRIKTNAGEEFKRLLSADEREAMISGIHEWCFEL